MRRDEERGAPEGVHTVEHLGYILGIALFGLHELVVEGPVLRATKEKGLLLVVCIGTVYRHWNTFPQIERLWIAFVDPQVRAVFGHVPAVVAESPVDVAAENVHSAVVAPHHGSVDLVDVAGLNA